MSDHEHMVGNGVGHPSPYADPYISSIYTGMDGNFRYSPSFNQPYLLAFAQIKMTGSRYDDYQAAEKTTGYPRPSGTTWHHVWVTGTFNDICLMQLVRTEDHVKTCPHAGACRQWAHAHNIAYRGVFMDDATPLNFLAEMSNTEDAASKQSIKETALSLGISIPETLKAYYAREKNLRMYYEISPDNIVELDYVLPLKGGQLSLAHSLKSLPAIKGMMPFGLDALGNIFYADPKGAVHFYDHESGSMTKAGSL